MIPLTGCQNGVYECQLTTLGYSMRLGGKNTGESRNFTNNTHKSFYRSLAKNFKSLNPDIFNSKNFSVISSFKVNQDILNFTKTNEFRHGAFLRLEHFYLVSLMRLNRFRHLKKILIEVTILEKN